MNFSLARKYVAALPACQLKYVSESLQKGPDIGKGQGISEKLLTDNFETKEMNQWPDSTNIGFLYYEGKGVRQDYKEAIKWYTMAASKGYPDASFDLGVAYSNGNGVERSGNTGIDQLMDQLFVGKENHSKRFCQGLGIAQTPSVPYDPFRSASLPSRSPSILCGRSGGVW